MELTNDEMLAILAKAMMVLQEEIGPELSVSRVSALLTVLRNPGMNQTDLRPTVLLSQQGTSRAVQALQGKGTAKEKYPALIAATPDPTYSRRNLLTPTPEAGALLSSLTGQVNKMLARKREAH